MAKKQKKFDNTPRQKKLKRPERLAWAKNKKFLKNYSGKNLVRGYARYFSVDLLCAIKELRLLGVNISEEREAATRQSLEQRAQAKRNKKQQQREAYEGFDSDDNFAFIVGYTSSGFPYGLTWEDNELLEQQRVETDNNDKSGNSNKLPSRQICRNGANYSQN